MAIRHSPTETGCSPFIMFVVLMSIWLWPGFMVAAAEPPGAQPDGGAIAESPEQPSVQKEGRRRPLQSLLQGATPEEQARLAEERKRLSASAAAFGTDPTAIVGLYQLGYTHNELTNDLKLNIASAVIRLPLTPNFLLQITLPYLWAELPPMGDHTHGIGDMTIRAGGRLYAAQHVALFIGTDASFPTAAEQQLGTGKYTLGPGGALAVPLARARSMFYLLVQDFNSVGGDSGRADIHFTQVQPAVNTFWSGRWWTSILGTWDIDWKNHRHTTLNLLGEVGHNFDNHWNVFVGAGGGVAGRDTVLGLNWTVQAGVRWVFASSVFSKALFGGFSGD